MIKIDFREGTHGHFLEYVSNVYIMQTTPSQCSIFKPPTYSAHAPDEHYLSSRLIQCNHYSTPEFNLEIKDNDNIIRIVIDVTDDAMFFIALTNIMFKAGDLGLEKQLLSIPDRIRNDPVAHRNNWYSKLSERESYVSQYHNFLPVKNAVFNFSFNSFFCFTDFCKDLNSLAEFLNQTFFLDDSLYDLWCQFIKVNQGWQSYIKCNQLLEDTFSNNSVAISCTVLEQGWINYNLSKICRLYNGKIFEDIDYPDNTQIIYNLVRDHLAKLR